MAQTPRSPYPARPASKARPGLDMVTVKRQAGQFPSVGQTLRSYQYDPRDKHRRQAQTVVKTGRIRRFFSKITLKRVVVTMLILILLVGGWVGGSFLYNAHKLFGGSILGVLKTTKLKGEDTGRVNILLAGNSADDPGHQGANLTDSIMLMSIDTHNNQAFLMSIPRDLWVHIPGDGHQKINAAYVAGQNEQFNEEGYPAGGMGELEKIISQDFGIDINYYALVNYNAFRDSVNAVGGIDYNVHSVDPRGLYDPSVDYTTHGPLVRLSNGIHHLNGQQALDLARARGDAYGSYGFPAADFDRTTHQREMMVALKKKVVSLGVIGNPTKLNSLANAIGKNVKTDMTISEFRRFYDLVKPINNIQSLSLNSANGKNLLASYAAPDGESALIPAAGVDDYSDIQSFLRRETSNNPVTRESAKIVILNATGVNGLASRQKTRLINRNLNVIAVGDARTSSATTAIIDNSNGKMPATKQLLAQVYGANVTTANPYSQIYNADFIVLLGSDQTSSSSQPQVNQ